jgi:uncharacterized protein (DUF924 family)
MQAADILHFWFDELTDKQHFAKDAALDELIRTRFGATLEAAARCELFAWRTTAGSRLAEIIVLDQFSRNVYRDTPPVRVRQNIPTSWLELCITEGRNRQVRRMTAAVGLPCLRLIRSAIGPYTLDGLAPGKHAWAAEGASF